MMNSAASQPSVRIDNKHALMLSVPDTEIVAVEHPMIIKNIDNALKTFGRGTPYKEMMNATCTEDILPLYLRPHDPTCAVLESHMASTSNVVLKITLPKRTGRRRKKGSQEPFLEYENYAPPSRLDASTVFRSLNDNVDKYHAEPLGVINYTHRYRGMTDFHKSNVNSDFMNRFRDQALSTDLENFKSFRFNLDRGVKLNTDVIPPPLYATTNLPYPWAYQRGAAGAAAKRHGQQIQSRIKGTHFVDLDLPIPTGPNKEPEVKYRPLVNRLRECFEVRPIWSKRALDNYLGNHKLHGEVRLALGYVSYQFHGGPWRDASIKFGVDPRSDPKYRIYQTLMFKIMPIDDPNTLRYNWVMSDFGDDAIQTVQKRKWESHIFDGQSFCMRGRNWQVCDITDPLLSKVFATNTLRDVADLKQDGWFCNGTHAKAKGIMRTKIRALQIGRTLSDEDFADTLKVPDNVILSEGTKGIPIPLPNVAIITQTSNKEWNMTKKQKRGRDMVTFNLNADHGSKRGKRLDAKGLQEAIAGGHVNFGGDNSVRQSIETSGDASFADFDATVEGNILDEEEDEDFDDDGDDASLDLHDDSSLDSGSDDDEKIIDAQLARKRLSALKPGQ